MKKINGLVLSTLTAAFLVGCGGGGGSSSSSGSASGTTTETPISVERGKVYGATVTDAAGNKATQKTNENIYVFATTPIYPITASGGIIDVDNNGIDEGDIELTTPLVSYIEGSTVITPITTYLGDIKTDSGKAKLAKLKEIAGVSSDDDFFKKAPSELLDDIGTNVLVLTNALFDIMNDGDTSNDDFVSSYTGSAFETKFVELKTEALKYTDKIEMAKALEEKVIANLGLDKLPASDLANAKTTTTLKVADLTRYITFDTGYSYDDNIINNGKINHLTYNLADGAWILEEEVNPDYNTITLDSLNPYKFSYVDSFSKQEGTFTILSTKKVANYADLYKTEAKIVITKMATELDWNRWDWTNPTYDSNSTPITNIDELYTYLSSVENAIVTKESDKVVYTSKDGKEHSYYRLVQENGNYYIEETDLNDVGYVYNETIYTGTSLDELITNMKAPAPVFTSWGNTYADENQTSAYTPTVTDSLKVTYSLSGLEASYFNIDSATGVVTFKVAPDYETKLAYSFYIIAKNSVGKSSIQLVNIKINNLEESTITQIEPTTSGFTANMINNKVFYPNSSTNSEEKIEFYSSGLLHAFHTYNTSTGFVNEPWSYSDTTPGSFTIIDGKLRTYFGEGTCYQFEITSIDNEKINVNATIDFSCESSSSMDEFEPTTQFNSFYFADTTLSNLPATKVITSINVIDSMISGKTITLSDGITYTFNADKTFTTSELGVTSRIWETSAFLNIYYQNNIMKTLVFTQTPAVDVVVLENSATNNFSSEVKTITNIQ